MNVFKKIFRVILIILVFPFLFLFYYFARIHTNVSSAGRSLFNAFLILSKFGFKSFLIALGVSVLEHISVIIDLPIGLVVCFTIALSTVIELYDA